MVHKNMNFLPEAGIHGNKMSKNLGLAPKPSISGQDFVPLFMGKNVRKKSSKIFRWPEMCPLDKILNLGPRF